MYWYVSACMCMWCIGVHVVYGCARVYMCMYKGDREREGERESGREQKRMGVI